MSETMNGMAFGSESKKYICIYISQRETQVFLNGFPAPKILATTLKSEALGDMW